MALSMALSAVTANRLIDGAVVYLDLDGGWTQDFGKAATLPASATDKLLAIAEAGVAAQIVIAPYAIDLVDDSGIKPVRFRERIRAFGPTTG